MDSSEASESSQSDPWGSTPTDQGSIEPVGDTAEWLGEASAEDVQRSQTKFHDVYAEDDAPSRKESVEITHVRVEYNDKFPLQILALGCLLLLSSSFVQVFRAENLTPPENSARETREKTSTAPSQAPSGSSPKTRKASAPQLPFVRQVRAEAKPGERVFLSVQVANRGQKPSKPCELRVEIVPGGLEPVILGAHLPSLPPSASTSFDIETPYELAHPLSDASGQFQTDEGLTVTYSAEIEDSE